MKYFSILVISIISSSCGIQQAGFSYSQKEGFKINFKDVAEPEGDFEK